MMVKLWGELFRLYDNQAVSKYGQVGGETFNFWVERLKDLEPADIERGLRNLLKDENDFPPGLKKFRSLCVHGQSSGLTHNTAAYEIVKPSRRLEKKPDVGKARVRLNTLREILK